ncbi:DUF2029 domain-containing protein [Halomonas sp. DQ26W]|uniref:glycosyltransferase family 87 protein n=1 Tax=Halomonas sp. DQ26W TaxID=2282311 RepID=UPI000DF7D5DB|nr:glycosyltransferase family 87 protein [Halomonas sp. DQ26W]RDB42459.1 DUF2029 domain-containing protein [Halomonas sp. DQ26W]
MSHSARSLVRPLAWLLVMGYLAFIALQYHQGYGGAAAGERPFWTDYTPTYGAALLARHEAPENLYYPKRMAAAARVAANAAYDYRLTDEQLDRVGFPPWMYPPTFIVLVLPLAYLAYLPSLAAWLILTAVPYLVAMRRILPDGGLLLALAAPPTFYNLMYGQTGFLIAGLIALGLVQLRRRPWLAGVLIGLASVKPHFGVLIPIALAAGGHWRVFVSASLTVVAMVVGSVLLLGMDAWYGFIGTLLFSLEGFGAGAYAWHAMTSVLSTVNLAGASLEFAWAVQLLTSGAMVLLVAAVWYRGRSEPATHGLQCAVLCLAATLAVPLVYLYDLIMVVPAAAWLLADLRARGGRSGEYLCLGGALALILPLYLIASRLGFQLGALPSAVLLGLALSRLGPCGRSLLSWRAAPVPPRSGRA